MVFVIVQAIVTAPEPLYEVPLKPVPIVKVAKLLPKEIPDIVLLVNLALAIDPANIAFVTTPAAIVVALPTEVTLPVKFAFVVTVAASVAVAALPPILNPAAVPVNPAPLPLYCPIVVIEPELRIDPVNW